MQLSGYDKQIDVGGCAQAPFGTGTEQNDTLEVLTGNLQQCLNEFLQNCYNVGGQVRQEGRLNDRVAKRGARRHTDIVAPWHGNNPVPMQALLRRPCIASTSRIAS
jgi:hypothetical protein